MKNVGDNREKVQGTGVQENATPRLNCVPREMASQQEGKSMVSSEQVQVRAEGGQAKFTPQVFEQQVSIPKNQRRPRTEKATAVGTSTTMTKAPPQKDVGRKAGETKEEVLAEVK